MIETLAELESFSTEISNPLSAEADVFCVTHIYFCNNVSLCDEKQFTDKNKCFVSIIRIWQFL